MKVLICDDEEVVLKVVQIALQNKDLEVVLARDGEQAMDQLKANTFDLILTDIHMPYYTADDVLRLVREEQKLKSPIVIMSSDGEEEVIAHALKKGANDFIVKPIDPDKLMKKIKRFLK